MLPNSVLKAVEGLCRRVKSKILTCTCSLRCTRRRKCQALEIAPTKEQIFSFEDKKEQDPSVARDRGLRMTGYVSLTLNNAAPALWGYSG